MKKLTECSLFDFENRRDKWAHTIGDNEGNISPEFIATNSMYVDLNDILLIDIIHETEEFLYCWVIFNWQKDIEKYSYLVFAKTYMEDIIELDSLHASLHEQHIDKKNEFESSKDK